MNKEDYKTGVNVKDWKIALVVALISICLFLLLLCVGFASAETYKIGENSELKMRCTVDNAIPSISAAYNVTITYSNGSILSNGTATPLGDGFFTYPISFPTAGTYYVYQFCRDNAKSYSNSEEITVTTTGQQNWNTIPIYFWIFGFLLLCIGLYQRNELFGFISACLFIVAGIYMMIYGFGIFNDMYTRTLSYVSLGFGIIIAFASVIEMFMEDDE
jgi:hypothetical membrane protein